MINGKDKTVENIIHKDQISILPKGCLISSTRYMICYIVCSAMTSLGLDDGAVIQWN